MSDINTDFDSERALWKKEYEEIIEKEFTKFIGKKILI